MEQNTGMFIAQLRKQRGMTQQELAAQLGVTDKAVSKWETGKGLPDVGLLIPLGDALGVSVNELLHGDYLSNDDWQTASDSNIIHAMHMLKRAKQNSNLYIGIIAMIVGFFLQMLSHIDWTSSFGQFMQGVTIGLSVGLMILGILLTVFGLVRRERIIIVKGEENY